MTKNILYVTTKLPWPLIGGDRIHMYNCLRELKKRGYNITVVTLVTEDDDLDGALKHDEFYTKLLPVEFNKNFAYLGALRALYKKTPFIVEYFYNSKMQKVIDNELKHNKYDLVIGYMIRSLPYLEKHKIKKIIHICDTYTMLYKRRLHEQRKLFDKLKIFVEYLKVKAYENYTCKITDKQVLISTPDRDFMLNFVENPNNLVVINWTTDTDYFSPQFAETGNNIYMVGSWQYIPNTEAAVYFAKNIFPLVKAKIPDAKFRIIGANPRKELYEVANEVSGIEITGRVDDVRDYTKDCKVSVCPTKIVSGMQTKILEALSMGIPIVATPESAKGVWEDLITIGYNDSDFADKVVQLLNNKDLRKSISMKSRDFIVNNLTWEKIGEQWNQLILEVLNG